MRVGVDEGVPVRIRAPAARFFRATPVDVAVGHPVYWREKRFPVGRAMHLPAGRYPIVIDGSGAVPREVELREGSPLLEIPSWTAGEKLEGRAAGTAALRRALRVQKGAVLAASWVESGR